MPQVGGLFSLRYHGVSTALDLMVFQPGSHLCCALLQKQRQCFQQQRNIERELFCTTSCGYANSSCVDSGCMWQFAEAVLMHLCLRSTCWLPYYVKNSCHPLVVTWDHWSFPVCILAPTAVRTLKFSFIKFRANLFKMFWLCLPQSTHHEWMFPGLFHLLRGALLGGLFASWARTLENDASVGAERGKRRHAVQSCSVYLYVRALFRAVMFGVHFHCKP